MMARTSSSRHRNILRSLECAKRCSTRRYGSTKMATYAMKKVIDFPPTESIVFSKLLSAENKIFLVFHILDLFKCSSSLASDGRRGFFKTAPISQKYGASAPSINDQALRITVKRIYMSEKLVVKILTIAGHVASVVSILIVLGNLYTAVFGSDFRVGAAMERVLIGIASFISSVVLIGFAYIVKHECDVKD